jgi:hypothetical protein
MTSIDKYPQLVALQNLGVRLREIPPDAIEWTEISRNERGEMNKTVKRPGSAREQLAAEAAAAARKIYGRWNSFDDDGQALMVGVVADVAEAAGDAELAVHARDTLREWGVVDER